MATDTAKVKPIPVSKAEAFVGEQLARAERRIRLLDLTTALLGFLAGTLAYTVLMVLIDRSLQLSSGLRQLSFFLYLGGAAFYLGWTVVLPLTRRINPYYAARQVEETLPGAKNSVINWLDLHEQKLAPAIRGAINNRAAKDLAKADIEKAISGQRAGLVGAVAGVLTVLFVILFLLCGPRQFSSLLGRAFAPFRFSGKPETRTSLEILRPEGGNATVPNGRIVPITVNVDGRVPEPGKPDAVKLLWRHDAREAYQVVAMQPQESAREWSTTLSATDVRDGFFYKITGGDAETPEYQVTVRPMPALTRFKATYHFLPYVGRVDEVRLQERTIEALRGTQVTLLVHTNRVLKSSQVVLDTTKNGKQTIPGRQAGADPQAFQVSFILDETGLYRLSFVSIEDEAFTEDLQYPMVALADHPPVVQLTKPGEDVHLPANGVLRLEGKASDDVGVESLTLHLKMVGAGPALRGKPYRGGKEGMKLPGGGYPRSVEYKDFVDFAEIVNAEGKPYVLQPGSQLEYWLEARDACTYPQANVTPSKHFHVIIDPVQQDKKKQEQDRNQAQQEQKEHEAKQNEERNKEDKARQEEKQKQEQDRQKQEDKANEKPGDGNTPPKDDTGNKAGDPDNGKGNNGKDDQGQDAKAEQKRKDEETRKLADDIKKAMEQEQKDNGGKDGNQSQAKDDKAEAKDDKPGGEGKPGAGQQGPGKEDKAEAKEEGPKGDKNQGGEPKEGAKDGAKDAPSAGKDSGKPEGKQDNKGDGKAGDPKGGQPQPKQAGDGKDSGNNDKGPEQQPANKPAEGKQEAPKEGAGQAGDQKAAGNPDEKNPAGDVKDGGKDGAQGAQGAGAAGEKKDMPTPGENRAAGKDGGNGGQKAGDQTASAKDGEKKAGTGGQAVGKEPAAKDQQKDLVQGVGKGDPDQNPPSDAQIKDLERLVKQLGSQDPDAREKAAKELERIKDEAKNPQIKKAAGQIKDLLDQLTDNQIAQNKPEQPEQDPPQPPMGGTPKPGETKPDKGDPMAAAGEPKPGDSGKGNQDRGTAKDGKGSNAKNQNPMDMNPANPPEKGEGDSTSRGKSKGAPTPGSTPNTLGSDLRPAKPGDPVKLDNQETPIRKDPADPRNQKATEAQLEDFKKKLDQKTLDRLKMTEEAKQQFLKNYAELAKRDQGKAPKNEKEVLPGPQEGPELKSSSTERTNVVGAPPPEDTNIKARGQAPPGYRDGYAELSRILNEQPAKQPKK
jgi:collagen type III alpha